MDSLLQKKIIDILSEKIPAYKCPVCNRNLFEIVNGFFANQIQNDLKSINIGGQAIPTVALICRNCGFVSQHSLGALVGNIENFLSENNKKPNVENNE